MDPLQAGPLRVSMAVYRILLLAYPPAHRREYGPWMRQLFRDLGREAFGQAGPWGLARLWLRTLRDLAESLTACYAETAEEVLMAFNRPAAPLPWGEVALVVIPGLLFGLAKVINPLGWPAVLGFLLVALLAAGVLAVRRHFPSWGLLALGLLTGRALLLTVSLPEALTRALFRTDIPVMRALATRLMYSPEAQRWLIIVPVWAATLWLVWKYRQVWRPAAWVVLLTGLAILAAAVLIDAGILIGAGLVLLPAALGLPFARRYGPLAALFLCGVFISLLLFDSDFYAGPLLNTQPFYPLFVIPLVWMMASIAPLLLLRARTLRAQAAGFLAPALAWGIGRVAVPWLVHPNFHPASTWLGDALLSAFVVCVLALGFYLYSQPGSATAFPGSPSGQPAG